MQFGRLAIRVCFELSMHVCVRVCVCAGARVHVYLRFLVCSYKEYVVSNRGKRMGHGVERGTMNLAYLGPVSYTHLDVYKRQP